MPAFKYRNFSKKLNLGCGNDKRKNFLNIDLNSSHKPDLISDVTNLEVLPDKYYSYILANDILEHIPRNKCLYALKEWNRVLQMEAISEVQVPNIIGLLELFNDPKHQNIKSQEELSRCLYGTQNYNGDYHYNGFTKITISHNLQQSGFHVKQLLIRDGWLFVVRAVKNSHMPRDPLIFITDYEEFIEQAYFYLLGRKADEEGKNYFLQQLLE